MLVDETPGALLPPPDEPQLASATTSGTTSASAPSDRRVGFRMSFSPPRLVCQHHPGRSAKRSARERIRYVLPQLSQILSFAFPAMQVRGAARATAETRGAQISDHGKPPRPKRGRPATASAEDV